MKTIAIVHYSGSGHTRQLAEAVARGAAAVPGIQVRSLAIAGTDIHEGRYGNESLLGELESADAIIFGTPTYMGGVAAQFKAFADATSGIWYHGRWRDKLASGFTHSGSPAGDKLATLQYLSLFAAQHGMVWLGNAEPAEAADAPDARNRTGTYLGAAGFGGEPAVHAGDLRTAEALGRRVAATLQHLQRPAILRAA